MEKGALFTGEDQREQPTGTTLAGGSLMTAPGLQVTSLLTSGAKEDTETGWTPPLSPEPQVNEGQRQNTLKSWASRRDTWELVSSPFLSETQSLNPIMRKHRANPNWETFYPRTGLCSSNMLTLQNFRLRICSRNKETEALWRLRASCGRGPGPGQMPTSAHELWRRCQPRIEVRFWSMCCGV